MAYYDPSSWVKDPTDKLIDDWEKIIILKKRAEERYTDSGYKPKNKLSLAVRVKEAGYDDMVLTLWQNAIGKIYIDLKKDPNFLRKGHYNTDWHTNPDGKRIPPPHHIHFPTTKYRTLEGNNKKYAYPVNVNGNYIEALQLFCQHNNIELRASLPFWTE